MEVWALIARPIVVGLGGTVGMMDMMEAIAVMDENPHLFPTQWSRTEGLQLLKVIDRAATEAIQKHEKAERQRLEEKNKGRA